MQMTMNRTKLSGTAAEIAKTQLQVSLVDLIDLTLQAKQAHWNVVGPRFRSVHRQLDELVAETRAFADTVAERIVILGDAAEGSARAVEHHTKLDPLAGGFLEDNEVVTLMIARLDATCGRIRQNLKGIQDPVSHDLLVQVLAKLEEQMWMFHAQTQEN
jgi:starvation-inducible DNA-binding protein